MHYFEQIAALTVDVVPEHNERIFDAENASLQLQTEHLRHLEKFLRPRYIDIVLPCQKMLEEFPPRIAFDMLWYIFRPGTDVYVRMDEVVHACVVEKVRNNLDNPEPGRFANTKLQWCEITVWYLDTDGSRIGRCSATYTIWPYVGLREVTRLGMCPTSFWDANDEGKRRQNIISRSKLHVKALQQGYLLAHYDGPVHQGPRYVRKLSFIAFNF